MSEIQSLTAQVERLSRSVDSWNKFTLLALVATAIAAASIVLTTRAALTRSTQLTVVQGELDKAKERKLQAILKNKDLKIMDAKQSAEEASERASFANERAAVAAKSAESIAQQGEQLRHQNILTEVLPENERAKRLELEKSLTPRRIPIEIRDGRSNFDSLKVFANINAIVEFIPDDAEAKKAAGSIAQILHDAGWNIMSFVPSSKVARDGVDVERSLTLPATMQSPEEIVSGRRSQQASSALVEFLEAHGWVAKETAIWMPDAKMTGHPFSGDTLAPSSVRIRVGLKPSPYFDPDWVKELERKNRQF